MREGEGGHFNKALRMETAWTAFDCRAAVQGTRGQLLTEGKPDRSAGTRS